MNKILHWQSANYPRTHFPIPEVLLFVAASVFLIGGHVLYLHEFPSTEYLISAAGSLLALLLLARRARIKILEYLQQDRLWGFVTETSAGWTYVDGNTIKESEWPLTSVLRIDRAGGESNEWKLYRTDGSDFLPSYIRDPVAFEVAIKARQRKLTVQDAAAAPPSQAG